MANRKRHAGESGYIAERMNPLCPGQKVVVYVAGDQGLDTGGFKYAIVCDAHHQIGGAASVPKARYQMQHPNEFCTDCRAIMEA